MGRFVLVFAGLLSVSAVAQEGGVSGLWRSPGGSVLRIASCGSDICAKIVSVAKSAPGTVDANNPDAGLRSRPLCGLTIGTGFHLKDATHAEDGRLYDPESGKTYKGSMTAEGNALQLRGYVGFKAFGRSETWTRTDASQVTCAGLAAGASAR